MRNKHESGAMKSMSLFSRSTATLGIVVAVDCRCGEVGRRNRDGCRPIEAGLNSGLILASPMQAVNTSVWNTPASPLPCGSWKTKPRGKDELRSGELHSCIELRAALLWH